MRGVTSQETHFHVTITSDAFQKKSLLARQRMVNKLLKDEMAMEGGIHSLQLLTMTPEEEDKRQQTGAEEEKARTCKD